MLLLPLTVHTGPDGGGVVGDGTGLVGLGLGVGVGVAVDVRVGVGVGVGVVAGAGNGSPCQEIPVSPAGHVGTTVPTRIRCWVPVMHAYSTGPDASADDGRGASADWAAIPPASSTAAAANAVTSRRLSGVLRVLRTGVSSRQPPLRNHRAA